MLESMLRKNERKNESKLEDYMGSETKYILICPKLPCFDVRKIEFDSFN